jgi:hypothetical protein
MHYATSRNIAGSIPDEVILFFKFTNPSSRTIVLGSTQSLTEMGTRNFPGEEGTAGRDVSLTTSPPSVSRLSRENVGDSTSHNPMSLHGLLQGQLYLYLTVIREPII